MPIVKTSRHAFGETLRLLTAAISRAGNTLFTAIDQADAARATGLTLRPTVLLVFGNPKGGTPLMDGFPLAALALPLKLLLWDADGIVQVAYTPMAAELERYGVPAGDPRVAAMDTALAALSDSVT